MIQPFATLCWKCGAPYELHTAKMPFSALCETCASWLHVCRNCKNYYPGLPNDCKIPDTEFVKDRESRNFCESFDLQGGGLQKTSDAPDAAKKLFGEEAAKEFKDENKKKGFDSLFGD